MGKTRYNKLREVLDKLKSEKGNDVSLQDFNMAILKNVTSSRRVILEVMALLRQLNMIEEKDDRIILN